VHGAVKVGDCARCHDPHSSDEKSLLRQPTIAGLCFKCHEDDVTGRAWVHKPVAEGKCTECHDPHGAKGPFNLKRGDVTQTCQGCHKPNEKKHRHAALDRVGCTGCHDAHGTANRFQLVKSTNALCQTCHVDKTDGVHVTNMVAGGHRISGVPDPHDPSRELSCASCHDPHGSDSPRLLRFGEAPMDVCDWCHGDRTGLHPELKDITRRKRPLIASGQSGPPSSSATAAAPPR
jgi:predicted CXXCH cytochrome family protein